MPQTKAKIKEIFESIQGEGLYIGVNQLFIRFSSCNLHCRYCDTDFKSDLKDYTADELAKIVNDFKNIHSVSLTGGEPLTEADFLSEFLPKVNKKVYLETNGTLYESLSKIINYVDIVSMDIKLPSATGMDSLFKEHEKFIEIAKQKETFLKVVFNEKITDFETEETIRLAKKYGLTIVLQPMMEGEYLKLSNDIINKTYRKFVEKYPNTRLIPQVHKFLKVR